MKKQEDMILIGHLQVMDEPLSSLYADRRSGKYYLSVRLYEETDDKTYLFSEVIPKVVLEYMSGELGLKKLFTMEPSFYYKKSSQGYLSQKDFLPLSSEEGCRRLATDGSLDDKFDTRLAYKSVNLRNYLNNL